MTVLYHREAVKIIDYHIHPNYSIDAEDYSVDSYCRRALEIGLAEICFTPHYEFDPVRKEKDWYIRLRGNIVPMNSDWPEYYLEDVENVKEKYSSEGLIVKAGLEVGYDLGLEESILAVIEKYPFDFIIGSVHCLDHIAISSSRESGYYYRGKSIQQVWEKYFNTLESAVMTGFFDVIGHFDIYRRHGCSYLGKSIGAVPREYVISIFKIMAEKGTGLEVNTSSLRHGFDEFYPGEELLDLALEYGINVFTTGSDSHRLSELGTGIKEADKLLREKNLLVSTFTKRKKNDGGLTK